MSAITDRSIAQVESQTAQLYDQFCSLLRGTHPTVDWSALDPINWESFGRMAREHGLAPLVFRQFSTTGWPAGVPQVLRTRLENAYFQSAAQNAALFQELDSITQALESAGIPAVLLKGAHLAASLYPDIALRPMHDLDILVAETDLDNARQVMDASGYSQPLAVISQNVNRDLGNHIYLSKNNSSLPGVELHWNLVGGRGDRRAAKVDWFWAHAEPLQGDRILALDPTANLLFLAAHLYLSHKGDSGRLVWLYDIHLLLQTWGERIDWQAAIQAAEDFGWMAALYGALRAARDDLGSRVPEDGFDLLLSAQPELARTPRRRSYLPHDHARDTLEKLSNYDPPARLRILLAVIFPSPAHMRWRYSPQPAWLWPLYYPVKWAGMARDGLRLLGQALK